MQRSIIISLLLFTSASSGFVHCRRGFIPASTSATTTSNSSLLNQCSTDESPQEITEDRCIHVSAETRLPVDAHEAYSAFEDLARQPDWSPWLSSVEYTSDQETLWKMKYLGFSFSWKSITTIEERPSRISWESTHGLKNFGSVEFRDSDSEEDTLMILRMTFVTPRILKHLVGQRSKSIVETKMLKTTLENFRKDMDFLVSQNSKGSNIHHHTIPDPGVE